MDRPDLSPSQLTVPSISTLTPTRFCRVSSVFSSRSLVRELAADGLTLVELEADVVFRGDAISDGKDVTALPPEKRNIAQVFQFPVLYDTMSVFNNLAFPLRNRGVEESEIKKRVLEVAEILLEKPQHMSADQIIDRLREAGSSVSKATVYNTLNLFGERGNHVQRHAGVFGPPGAG